MSRRTDLQTILETLLGSDKVYFQPPESVKLIYPCIVFERAKTDTKFANNKPYLMRARYEVKVIDKNPDSLIPDKVANLPLCTHDRYYAQDNLNHNVFTLYY